MEFKYIDELMKPEWEALVTSNEASGFMQSFFWAEFQRSIGAKTYKMGIFDGDTLLGGAVVIKNFISDTENFLYISQGPVVRYDRLEKDPELFFALLEAVKIKMTDGYTTHLSLDPLLRREPFYFNILKKARIDLQPRHTLLIDLLESEERLLAEMKPKGRYNINLAKQHGVQIVQDNSPQATADFISLQKETAQRHELRSQKDEYFKRLVRAMNEGSCGKVFTAKKDGESIAAGIFIFYGNRATYLYGASSQKYKSLMAPSLLHWEALCYAKKIGCTIYDFFGILPPEHSADTTDPWYGITEFKLKFGGQKQSYAGLYSLIFETTIRS